MSDQTTERFDKRSAGNIDCIDKAKDGEPMWIILGRDPVYEETVEFWARARERAIADGRIEDTPHEREHIAIARRYVAAGWRMPVAASETTADPEKRYRGVKNDTDPPAGHAWDTSE